MIYKYKAVSRTGEIIEGFYEGKDESDVLAMLKGNSYLIMSVEKDLGAESQIDLLFQKIKKKDLAVFCRQFYTMLDAGIGIVKCLDILEKQSKNRNLAKSISSVYEDVQKGFTLSEAMMKHKKVFPQLLTHMVEAGEVSGNLDTIMERMAVHFEKENKLEQKIKSAMIYPIALAIVSIAVVIFLLVSVMPTFIGMFENSRQALPKPTQILLNISNWLTLYWYLLIIVVIGLVAGFIIFKNTPSGRTLLDALKLRIPVVKDTNIKIITSRFSRNLSTLMTSGIPITQSIEVVSRIVGNKVVHDRLEVAIDNVKKGVSLSRAIQDIRIFPPMVDSMINVGEESGALDDILYKTADFYDDEVEAALQKLTTLIEPVMLIVMAIIIGFIVISMAMPMFEMVNTI